MGLAWVRGVYGAVERRLAAPAVVGRLGLVLDTELGFWGHGRTDDDGRRNRAPPIKPPLFFEQETATELGFRFPFFCGFKNYYERLKKDPERYAKYLKRNRDYRATKKAEKISNLENENPV